MTKNLNGPVDSEEIPTLGLDWQPSRWGPDDQRGNGNLMSPAKVLEATRLIRTGEIVSLGWPYDSQMPLAPGRVFALRMPGGPTGGPYGEVSRTVWNDEFISTEIGQIGTHMDALGHLGCQCGAMGDRTNMLFYNGNRLSDMWSPYGLKRLGIENAPPFYTRGILFDVQGLKGRVLDAGEEVRLADLRACSSARELPRIRSHQEMRCSCAPATGHAGTPKPKHSTTARQVSASKGHVGLQTNRFAWLEPIILPLMLCRRSTRKCSILAINISS